MHGNTEAGYGGMTGNQKAHVLERVAKAVLGLNRLIGKGFGDEGMTNMHRVLLKQLLHPILLTREAHFRLIPLLAFQSFLIVSYSRVALKRSPQTSVLGWDAHLLVCSA